MAKKKATTKHENREAKAQCEDSSDIGCGNTKPSEVIAEMKSKHGVEVKPGLVGAVKRSGNKSKGKRGRPAKVRQSIVEWTMGVDTFLAVQRLIQQHRSKITDRPNQKAKLVATSINRRIEGTSFPSFFYTALVGANFPWRF